MLDKVSPNIRGSLPKYLGKSAQMFGEASPNVWGSQPKFGEASPNLGKPAQIWAAAAVIDYREWSRRFSRVRRPIENLIKRDKKKSSWSWKDKTVLRSFTEFYKVLQSFTKFYQSVPPKILNCDKTGFFIDKTSLIGNKTGFPLSNERS